MNFTLKDLKLAITNLILDLFPELGDRTHLPFKAKILALHGDAGTPRPDSGQRYYSVDLEPLKPDGTPDPKRAILKDVPLDVPWSGTSRGVLSLPRVGGLVRVGFYNGDPNFPYIDGMLSDGNTLPATESGELLIQYKDGVYYKFDKDGNIKVVLQDQNQSNIDVSMMGNFTLTVLHPSAEHNITFTADGDINLTSQKKNINLTTDLLKINILASSEDVNIESGAKNVNVTASKKVVVVAGTVAEITAPSVVLAGGGPAVARVGDSVQVTNGPSTYVGTITSGSGKVTSG